MLGPQLHCPYIKNVLISGVVISRDSCVVFFSLYGWLQVIEPGNSTFLSAIHGLRRDPELEIYDILVQLRCAPFLERYVATLMSDQRMGSEKSMPLGLKAFKSPVGGWSGSFHPVNNGIDFRCTTFCVNATLTASVRIFRAKNCCTQVLPKLDFPRLALEKLLLSLASACVVQSTDTRQQSSNDDACDTPYQQTYAAPVNHTLHMQTAML